MKIAFVIIGIIVLVILGIIFTGLIKDHLDEKARNKEYQRMLTKQKREAEWRSEIRTSRSNIPTTNFASGSAATPRKAATGKRYPVRRDEDGTYVVSEPAESFDGFWIDTPSTDSSWTSSNDDNSRNDWSSSNDSSSSNSSSDSGSSFSSDSESSSSSSDSSSSSSSDYSSSPSSDY